MKFFMYGTLRTGGCFTWRLPKKKKSKICTIHGLKMYMLGQFPGVIRTDDPDDYVIGEIQEYDFSPGDEQIFIELLDQIEGVYIEDGKDIGLFKKATAITSDGEEVLIYEFNQFEDWKFQMDIHKIEPRVLTDWALVDPDVAREVPNIMGITEDKDDVALEKAEQKD
jgi:gamma-glutamylcyclotransferase (GGCT)/AIG2-like uncharacterized protein YtfP